MASTISNNSSISALHLDLCFEVYPIFFLTVFRHQIFLNSALNDT